MLIVYLIVAATLILDQATKHLIVYHMDLRQSIEVIPGFLYMTSHRNAGAAWGILQDQMAFFYVVTLGVLTALIIWMRKLDPKKDRLLLIALALLMGGAIGNFIDRIFFREVVDFIDIHIFGYDFPIFNVADMALTFGVVVMGADALLESRRGRK